MFIIVPNFYEFAIGRIKWRRQLDKWKSYLHMLVFCTINTFEFESISKEINCAEHEYLNMSPHLLSWRSHWWNWHYFKTRYILNVNSFDTRYIGLTALLHNKGRQFTFYARKTVLSTLSMVRSTQSSVNLPHRDSSTPRFNGNC